MIYVCSLKEKNDARVAGKSIISNLNELYIAVTNLNARVMEIEDDFVEKFFTPKSLETFITEAKRLNKFLTFNVSSKSFSTLENSIAKLLSLRAPEEFISYLLRDKEAVTHIHKLCLEYNREKEEALKASAQLSTMHLQMTELSKELARLKDQNSILSDVNERNNTRLETLVSRINYKYDKELQADKMLGIKIDFRKYNKILYVKEITRVVYTDTLLYYLQEILRTLYGVPARFVVIEAAYAYKKVELYSRCKSHLSLTYEDIYKSDIFMAGFHSSLMEDILRNPSNARFLIILDRSGWESQYVWGDGVEPIYCTSDVNDVKQNISLKRLLSYNKETLIIPHISNFNKLSMEERIGKYSSMPVMQSLIELMERSD